MVVVPESPLFYTSLLGPQEKTNKFLLDVKIHLSLKGYQMSKISLAYDEC